jgi:hypothetical protein
VRVRADRVLEIDRLRSPKLRTTVQYFHPPEILLKFLQRFHLLNWQHSTLNRAMSWADSMAAVAIQRSSLKAMRFETAEVLP